MNSCCRSCLRSQPTNCLSIAARASTPEALIAWADRRRTHAHPTYLLLLPPGLFETRPAEHGSPVRPSDSFGASGSL